MSDSSRERTALKNAELDMRMIPHWRSRSRATDSEWIFCGWNDSTEGVDGHWEKSPKGRFQYLFRYLKTELKRCLQCGRMGGPKLVEERWAYELRKDYLGRPCLLKMPRITCRACHRRAVRLGHRERVSVAFSKQINKLKRMVFDAKRKVGGNDCRGDAKSAFGADGAAGQGRSSPRPLRDVGEVGRAGKRELRR